MSQSSKTIHRFRAIRLTRSKTEINTAGSTITLGPEHSGEIIALTATGGSAVTLPAPLPGLSYHFVVQNTGAHTLTAPSACINGAVANGVYHTSANLATGAAKTSISTTAGSAIGDTIYLNAVGTKYFLSGSVTNFNAIKFA